MMKNSALVWVFIVGIVGAVLFAFNYQGNQNKIPLSEIFPEEETFPVDVDYEFVDEKTASTKNETADGKAGEVTKKENESVMETAKAIREKDNSAVPQEVKEALNPDSSAEIPFTIQIASFKSKDAAEKGLAKVLDKGYQGYIVSRNLGEKGVWHRVYAGVYQDQAQAQQELTKIQEDYPGSFVIAPK